MQAEAAHFKLRTAAGETPILGWRAFCSFAGGMKTKGAGGGERPKVKKRAGLAQHSKN